MSLLFILLLLVSTFACDSDSQCSRMNSCIDSTCRHNSLFPLTLLDLAGAVLVFFLISCGISAGTGGGQLMFPVLLTVFSFSPHEGIPIVQASAMTSSFVAFLQRICVRRANSSKPMIDYEVAMFCLPALTLGNLYGVRLNQMFPQWLLIVLIVMVLGYTLVKTIKLYVIHRAIRLHKTENQLHSDGAIPLVTGNGDLQRNPVMPLGFVRTIQICVIVLEFLSFVLYVLLVGGKSNPSLIGVHDCSLSFWLLFAGYHILVFALTFWLGRTILRRSTRELTAGVLTPSGSLQWSLRPMLFICIFSFAAGLGGTMLLVGAGLILGPLLLSYKVDAQITSATTLLIVLVSASTGALQYWVDGVLDLQFAGAFGVVAALAAVMGVSVVKWAVNRYRRTSFIVFTLAGIVATSFVVVPIYDGITVYKSVEDGSFRGGFNSLCF